MEVELVYYAKDGRKFSDPLKCQEYEKTLDHYPGTVARAKIDLASLGENLFISGLLVVFHENKLLSFVYNTMNIERYLEDYVPVLDLPEDKRYDTATIKMMLKTLQRFDDDDQCEYSFIYCRDMDMAHCGYTKTNNPLVWKKLETK